VFYSRRMSCVSNLKTTARSTLQDRRLISKKTNKRWIQIEKAGTAHTSETRARFTWVRDWPGYRRTSVFLLVRRLLTCLDTLMLMHEHVFTFYIVPCLSPVTIVTAQALRVLRRSRNPFSIEGLEILSPRKVQKSFLHERPEAKRLRVAELFLNWHAIPDLWSSTW